MRYHLLVLALMAGAATPALAQSSNETKQVERRLERIEQELRAVQRRVFPGGNVEPEISTAAQPGTTAGLPATSAVADLTARVDALESRLAALTNQAEANENRIRQAEADLATLRQSLDSRLDQLEARPSTGPATTAGASETRPSTTTSTTGGSTGTRPAATTVTTPTRPATTTTAAATVDTGDAEEAYNVGFRLWDQQRYPEAEQALEAMIAKYPRSRFVSWSKNLLGRAYLDEGKPATAARTFLANYQDNPRGERAADSLFFLGQALLKLNKAADACKAYDELQDVYGETMRPYLKERLPAARAAARCR